MAADAAGYNPEQQRKEVMRADRAVSLEKLKDVATAEMQKPSEPLDSESSGTAEEEIPQTTNQRRPNSRFPLRLMQLRILLMI